MDLDREREVVSVEQSGKGIAGDLLDQFREYAKGVIKKNPATRSWKKRLEVIGRSRIVVYRKTLCYPKK